ncbi:MAG: prepilin-type N-terminal cleavage/methylation domain-containing protein [Deltaproteobacteria bacterium]|nr:prepilin-type N-terminal cleavage/methylation domain-containing protein [Deltaproteobacteria bacterium]
MNHRRGFTLVEVIVILAVLSVLAAIAVPMALRIFESAAEDATREEMDNLKKAMIGDTRKLQSSFRSDFGFLGDMGCLPTDLGFLLNRTVGATTLPLWSFDSTLQVGAGWKGPYITGAAVGEEIEEFTTDQLGNPYTYTPSGDPSPTCSLDATLTSNGPDGAPSTSDDITLAILPNETTATIRGSVKDTVGNGVASIAVDLNFPSNGSLSTVPATTDLNGNYSFTFAPFGARSVMVGSSGVGGLSYESGSASISGAANNNVDFRMINSSGSDVTITRMTVACTGATRYDDIVIDGSVVDSGSNHRCGNTVNISATTVLANPNSGQPTRIFVDSVDSQLPDLILRSGTMATIQLSNFETIGPGGGDFDMTGQSITVTFLNGSIVVGTASFTL